MAPNAKSVRIVSFKGEVRQAQAILTGERRPFITIICEEPFVVHYDQRTSDCYSTRSSEFYLDGPNAGQMMIWGQGTEFPRDTWTVHPEDLASIQ